MVTLFAVIARCSATSRRRVMARIARGLDQ
jgi:hypothetical protein